MTSDPGGLTLLARAGLVSAMHRQLIRQGDGRRGTTGQQPNHRQLPAATTTTTTTTRVWRLADGTPFGQPLDLAGPAWVVALHGNIIVIAGDWDIAIHQPAAP